MNRLEYLVVAAVAAVCFPAAATRAVAQIGVSIGPAPVCPYGYFDYPPCACASHGYDGPEWIVGGVFIGARPWFRGPAHFPGHVNNPFDLQPRRRLQRQLGS